MYHNEPNASNGVATSTEIYEEFYDTISSLIVYAYLLESATAEKQAYYTAVIKQQANQLFQFAQDDFGWPASR